MLIRNGLAFVFIILYLLMSFFFQVIFSLCKIIADDLKKIIIFRGVKCCGKWYVIILGGLVIQYDTEGLCIISR